MIRMKLANLVHVFLLLRLCSGGSTSKSASVKSLAANGNFPKKYTLFYNADRIHRFFNTESNAELPADKLDAKSLKGLEPESIPVIENFNSSIDVRHLLDRALSSTLSNTQDSKYVKVVAENQLMVCSLATWPFGWKHFTMTISDLSFDEESQSYTLFITTTSPSAKKAKRFLHFALDVELEDNASETLPTLVVQSSGRYSGLSKNHAALIQNAIVSAFKSQIRFQYQLMKARSKQAKVARTELEHESKRKKELELDRTINPEKYRSKSATVRRAHSGKSGSGTGRYKPGAATEARRQVKRGG